MSTLPPHAPFTGTAQLHPANGSTSPTPQTHGNCTKVLLDQVEDTVNLSIYLGEISLQMLDLRMTTLVSHTRTLTYLHPDTRMEKDCWYSSPLCTSQRSQRSAGFIVNNCTIYLTNSELVSTASLICLIYCYISFRLMV